MQDRATKERVALLQALRGLEGSEIWEAVGRICLGEDNPRPEAPRSVRHNLQERHRGCLRDNDLAGARYWMGKIEMLEELFQGQLITLKIKELAQGGYDGGFDQGE